MELKESIIQNLDELKKMLFSIENQYYSKQCVLLDEASIGKHVRHILELFTCLLQQYESGTINYDKRKRDISIETIPEKAIEEINLIINSIDMPDKELKLITQTDVNYSIEVKTNYYRELVYNFEHSIHHKALIKVALQTMGLTIPNSYFGYSPSTIQYNTQITSS